MSQPKFKQIKLSKQSRKSYTHLLTLKTEVERSRIAVEHMTSYNGMNQREKLGDLQQDLQIAISYLNSETKKNIVLTELVAILKGEMFKYQSTRHKEDEENEVKKGKQVSKLQNDISQILQRQNEQIAKILNMKELGNNKRSERVVYSNLFKKIEKEIKMYEDVYREQVAIGEIRKFKAQIILQEKNKIALENNAFEERKRIEEVQNNNQDERSYDSRINEKDPWSGFLTIEPKARTFYGYSTQRKGHTNSEDRTDARNSYVKEEKFAHTKDILRKIQQYTALLEKVRIYTECSSTEEILNEFTNLSNKNNSLMDQISEIDLRTEYIEEQRHKLKEEVTQEQILKKMTILPHYLDEYPHKSVAETNQKNNTKDSYKTKQEEEEMAQILVQISELFGIKKEEIFSSQQMGLKVLDKKISTLSHLLKSNAQPSNISRKEDTMSDSVLDCLFEKMERYGNSERILDQSLFRKEYYEQLTKKRPTKLRKDTSKFM